MNTLLYYLSFPFVQYALITGAIISLSSSLLGVTLVTRRLSFIGDSLSHVAFSASAIASILQITYAKLPVTLIGTLIFTILLLNGKRKTNDAVLAVISVTSLAIGYIAINLFSGSANVSADVCTTLFGSTSILTLTKDTVMLCIVLSLLVIGIFILSYNRIFSITFDEDFSQAAGIQTKSYKLLISLIITVIIVLAMNLVGSLLITALIVFPSLTAMLISGSFKQVTITSCVLSVICTLAGILISILAGTPVGSTIVIADMVVYLVVFIIKEGSELLGYK